MYIYYNPNPLKLLVGDCTIRAISKVTYQTWEDTYLDLIHQGLTMYDYPMYSRRGGYSRTSSKEEVMEELKDLMRETNDDAVRNAISDAISKMNK